MNKKIKDGYSAEYIIGYDVTMEIIHYLLPSMTTTLGIGEVFRKYCFFYEINEVPNFKSAGKNSIFDSRNDREDSEILMPMYYRQNNYEEPISTICTKITANYDDEDKKEEFIYFSIFFHYSQSIKEILFLNKFKFGPLSYTCIFKIIKAIISQLLFIKTVTCLDLEDEFSEEVKSKFGINKDIIRKKYTNSDIEFIKFINKHRQEFLDENQDSILSVIDEILNKKLYFYFASKNEDDENFWFSKDLDNLR